MDTTSSNAQRSHDRQDFIGHELEITREAIKSTAADIWQQVPTTDEIAAWTKANPMLAVGIAAGAGVLAGLMVTPSKSGGRKSRRGESHGGIFGSIAGAVLPAFSLAATEAGRSALSAAVAHFTAQNTAAETAEQRTAEELHARGAAPQRASSPEAA